MCAMAACRRSARLAPIAKLEVVAPAALSRKASLFKSVKVEPLASQRGLDASAPFRSGSKRKLGFEADKASRTGSVPLLPLRKSERITDSFKVVKQEECRVDKNKDKDDPLPCGFPSLGGVGKVKIEAAEETDDTKKPIVFVRRDKSKTEATSLPKSKVRPTPKRRIKREISAEAAPVNVKEENRSGEIVEGRNEIASLATGPAFDLAAQATLQLAVTSGSPYPDFARPYPEECREVRDRLSDLHGMGSYARGKSCPSIDPPQVLALEYRSGENTAVDIAETLDPCKIEEPESEGTEYTKVPSGSPSERRTVLDSLVGTILSQNTTDNNSTRAFSSLKRAFPTWEEVHAADPREVEDAIRCGGLAETKAKRIVNILDTIFKERGSICLEYVRSMSVDEIKAELSRFKGVGPKTVACVLMFHLEQNEFPVDTHVFRLSKMLGWVPANADREKTYLHMNNRVPDDVKYDLHCLLVTHGKRCSRCAKGGRAQTAPDGPCPLINWSAKVTLEKSADLKLLKGEESLEKNADLKLLKGEESLEQNADLKLLKGE